jgi:hypothetical protein
VEDLKGNSGVDTFNATASNATTGAAQTDLSLGDKIDGGLGSDTLNITITADNNKVLPTAGNISSVEIVNITGANNIAASTTTAAAASAGAKQVQVLDIGNLSLEAEQQTLNYVGLTKNGAGTLAMTVAGVTVTTAAIAADATAATIATAVATAINSAAAIAVGSAGSLNGLVTSASATSGIVTVNFTAAAGDVAAIAAGTGDLTGGAAAVAETKTSSAEIQSFAITTAAAANTNTITFANNSLGTGQVVYTSAGGLNTTTESAAIALAINTLITAADAKVSSLVRAESSTNNVRLIFKATAGDVAETSLTINAGIVAGAVAETRKGGEVDHVVSINGAKYTVTSVVGPNVLSTTTATALAAQNTAKDALRTAVNTELTKLIGDAVTIGVSDEAGEIKLTSKTSGTVLPTVSVTSRDSATNMISVDSADVATVANAEITSASGAVAQQIQYTVGGTVATGDSFTLFINGVSYGKLDGYDTDAKAATGIATAVNTVLGANTATAVGGTVTITAPAAGTPLPVMSIATVDANGAGLTFSRTDLRDNVDVLGTTTTAGAASIAATNFTGLEQLWLKGAASNATALTAVAATQTAGFDAVTTMANSVSFGATVTAGNVNISGSSGALSVTGAAMSQLNLSGTGTGTSTTGVVLTDGSSTDTVKTLSASTTAGTVVDTAAMTALASVTQSGAGGLTLVNAGNKVASVTTGEGADNIKINTATVVDDASTPATNETVSSSVSTGGGADRVTVSTTGAGLTTVNTGAGADSVFVTGVSTGVASINTGDDADTIDLIAVGLGSYPSLKVNAGAGIDTLVMGGATFTAVDYLRMNAALSDFEAIRFSTAVGGLDAGKLSIGQVSGFTFNAGANVITEVGAGTTLTVASVTAATTAATNQPAGSNYAGTATGLTASAAGFVQGSGAVANVYGGSLSVTSRSDANALVINGSSATVTVASTGGSSTTSIAADVTLGTSNVQSLSVNLSSARGTTTNAAEEYVATFAAGTIANTAVGVGTGETLEFLSSLKVSGSGVFSINTGTATDVLANLRAVDVSGMTVFANQDVNGALANATNLSTTSITLNNNVSETVSLGGAKDTIVTGSTVAKMDTITGFALTASLTNPATLDADRSDVLNVPGTLTFAKFTTTATSLIGALTEAGAHTVAGAAVENLLFTFGGDTYVYVDLSTGGASVAGLDDGDVLVKLVGTSNLDLLISAAG